MIITIEHVFIVCGSVKSIPVAESCKGLLEDTAEQILHRVVESDLSNR